MWNNESQGLSAVFGPYTMHLSGYYCSLGPVLATCLHQVESWFKETPQSMMETFHKENPSRCETKVLPLPSCAPTTLTHTLGVIGIVRAKFLGLTSSCPQWQQCELQF